MNESKVEHQTIADTMTAFASTVRNGLILLIGESSLVHCNAILSGMDAMTRLVVNLPKNASLSEIEQSLNSDLRVAVHRQRPEEFLEDVSRHSLNLVVLDGEVTTAKLIRQLSNMLLEGGCIIVPESLTIIDESTRGEFQTFHYADIGSCDLFVKKARQLEKVRRGGRRARLAGKS